MKKRGVSTVLGSIAWTGCFSRLAQHIHQPLRKKARRT
jgi:hypothetical protein